MAKTIPDVSPLKSTKSLKMGMGILQPSLCLNNIKKKKKSKLFFFTVHSLKLLPKTWSESGVPKKKSDAKHKFCHFVRVFIVLTYMMC